MKFDRRRGERVFSRCGHLGLRVQLTGQKLVVTAQRWRKGVVNEGPSSKPVQARVRRLNAASTSFRAIDNEVRMELSVQYMALGYRSNKEIAHRLNCAQSSTFYRAFENWHGITPKEYRARP